MPVEIQILSGNRQGQRLIIDAAEFRAGTERDCELLFDPTFDAGARDRRVQFSLKDDGWWVAAIRGTDVRVNQQRVAAPVRILSGNVVRMSDRGPDFSFSLVTRAAAEAAAAEAAAASAAASAAAASGFRPTTPQPISNAQVPDAGGPPDILSIGSIVPAAAPLPLPQSAAPPSPRVEPWNMPVADKGPGTRAPGPSGGFPGPAPAPQPISEPGFSGPQEGAAVGRLPDRPRAPSAGLSRVAIWVAGAVVLLVVLVLAMRPPVVIIQPQDSPSTGKDAKPGGKEADAGAQAAAKDTGSAAKDAKVAPPPASTDVAAKPPEVSPTPPSEPAAAAPPAKTDKVMPDTVYLIQVQKGPAFFPFATCCAVADDTVLTTGREALQLAQWRANPNERFRFWVTNAALRVKREILDIRVHAVFAALADKPNDWIYYDLAVLTVEGKLPHVAQVAPVAEASLEDGSPLTCCAFVHSGDKINRSDKLEPTLAKGKVYIVTHRADLPSNPRLLHFQAKFGDIDPPNAFGAPLFDDHGKVVAIYGERSSPPEKAKDQPNLNLHYAPVVSSELIDLWTAKRDEKIWIAPPLGQPESDAPAKP